MVIVNRDCANHNKLWRIDIIMKKKKKKKKEDGFTFVEILVAVAIILILATTVGIAIWSNVAKANVAAAKSQIHSFELALNSYYLDCGTFPTEQQGLNALFEAPDPKPNGYDGPYIAGKVPKDPWGNEYVYRLPGPNNLPFEIICYGADGTEGGEGNNKDIVSWE
jgi:general secretion pathway protein G